MEQFLEFILLASIAMALFFIPYWAFLQHLTFFKMNRVYLLGSIAVSLLVPLVSIPVHTGMELPALRVMIEPVTVGSGLQGQHQQASNDGIRMLSALYFSGTFIFIGLFLFRFYRIFSLIGIHGYRLENGLKLVKVDKGFAPASFFNFVFLSSGHTDDEILEHEAAHIRQGHSWDILMLELMIVFFWFHPFVWMYRKSVRKVHEYLADEATLKKGFDRSGYQHLVFENALGVNLNSLAASFNYSPLKERLIMMTKNRSKNSAKLQYLLGIVVLGLALVFMCCESNENIDSGTSKPGIVETNDAPPPPPPPIDGSKESIESKQDEEAFTIVEEMPSFGEKGIEAFRQYIAENLKYPEEAKAKKIQGRVYVKFVVGKDGKVKDAGIARSADPLLDAEALRVISGSPLWKPGKQRGQNVNVQFTFPINFEL
jgi:TonB family protein